MNRIESYRITYTMKYSLMSGILLSQRYVLLLLYFFLVIFNFCSEANTFIYAGLERSIFTCRRNIYSIYLVDNVFYLSESMLLWSYDHDATDAWNIFFFPICLFGWIAMQELIYLLIFFFAILLLWYAVANIVPGYALETQPNKITHFIQ